MDIIEFIVLFLKARKEIKDQILVLIENQLQNESRE